MKEVWKNIHGYEGQYQVSNLGRVKSLDRIDARGWKRKGKIIKATANQDGYLVVGLTKNNFHKKFFVHRLVAKEFIPNPNNHPIINHKDEDKSNNNLENLEWCDYKYNSNYGNAKEKAVSNRNYDYSKTDYSAIAAKNRKPIIAKSIDEEKIIEFPSVKSVREKGFNLTIVSSILNNRRKGKVYKNMTWEYKQG